MPWSPCGPGENGGMEAGPQPPSEGSGSKQQLEPAALAGGAVVATPVNSWRQPALPPVADHPLSRRAVESVRALLAEVMDEVGFSRRRDEAIGALSDGVPMLGSRVQGRLGSSPTLLLADLDSGMGDGSLWVIGDTHADVAGLEAALAHSTDVGNPEADCWLLLGDLVDRGPFGDAVLVRLLEFESQHPGRVLCLAGNHDVALRIDADGMFRSDCDPSEYARWLNREASTACRELGRRFAAWAARWPRAVLLPDGLWIAHGGFPHSDLWESMTSLEDMGSDLARADMTWNRLADARRKLVWRETGLTQYFGSEDFEGFCRMARGLGLKVERLLRGHDHPEGRVETLERYGGRVTTICNLAWHAADPGPPQRNPCIARWRPERGLELHRLILPENLLSDSPAARLYFDEGQ